MDANYVLACGIVWYKTADAEAGSELVEALQSPDPCVRRLAHTLLAEAGEQSMGLLESALTNGDLCTQIAGPCMAEILHRLQVRQTDGQTVQERLTGIAFRTGIPLHPSGS